MECEFQLMSPKGRNGIIQINKFMKKTFWLAAILVIVAGIWVGLKPNQSNQTIKIGVVSPLTGGKAQVGEGLRHAILLGQQDFGNTKKQYEFVFEDSAGESAKSASAVQKLISIDKVSALISISSQDGNITAKAAEEYGIPHISIANDSKVAHGEYNFVHWTPLDEQAKLFIEELKRRNIKNVAIIGENNDSSIANIDAFKKYIAGTDIKIVWHENFNKGTSDFRTMITKLKESNPELIMLQAFSPALEVIAAQLKELKVATPVSSITNIGTAKDLKPFEGVWYVSGGQPSEDFNSKFKAGSGYDSTIGAHYGYEIAQIYLTVFEKTDDLSGENIKEEIKDFDFSKFDSITGLSGQDSEGQFISPGAVILIQNGKNVEVRN